jgi:hypothetical protein
MLAIASQLLLVGLVLLWAATIVAVARDAGARIANRTAPRAAAALAAALPFVGVVVWLCVRPGETRLERRERRLRTATLERELQTSPVYVPPPRPAADADAPAAAA